MTITIETTPEKKVQYITTVSATYEAWVALAKFLNDYCEEDIQVDYADAIHLISEITSNRLRESLP